MDENDWENGRGMRRKARIAYYSERVEQEEFVYDFLDDLDSGFDDDELKLELEKVKRSKHKIEVLLSLDGNNEFCTLLIRLTACVNQIKGYQRVRIKAMDENVKNKREMFSGEVENLKKIEANTRKYAQNLEDQIFKICMEAGLPDPHEFCLLEQLDE